jgi:hypothetical protein
VLYKLIYRSWFFDISEVRTNCYNGSVMCRSYLLHVSVSSLKVDTGMMFSVPYVNAISYIDVVVYVFMNVMIYPMDEQSFVSFSCVHMQNPQWWIIISFA